MAEPRDSNALASLERGVRSLLFSREPPGIEGLDTEAQALYRRLVRTTLSTVVKNAVPKTHALLSDEGMDKLLARWLEEAPPTTRILRRVPEGFAAFCQSLEDPPHPALPELVAWEVLEIEVTHAPDFEGALPPATPDENATVLAHPSARLAVYLHPVQNLKKEPTEWPRPSKAPSFLVAYRAAERCHWVRVPKLVAQVLLHTGEGLALGQAFAVLDEQMGAAVDRGLVRSWLVNLQRRGALVGFPRASEEATP